MFLPYLTGEWSSSNMTWEIGANGGLALALVWLYFMCWSSYGIEVVATFAPEYEDTERDTAKALRAPLSSPPWSTSFCRSEWGERSERPRSPRTPR